MSRRSDRKKDMGHRPSFLSRGRLLGLVAMAFVLASCASGRLDTMKPKGDSAEDIWWINQLSGWMATAVGVFVALLVIVAIVKFRARPDDDPDELPEQSHGNRNAEILMTLIPVGMLVVLAVVTLPTIFDLSEKSDGPTIKVEGQQWWWQFSYDVDGDGTYDIVTANDIVIPVDVEVNLEIHSNDVIHSFWVPELNGKKDAVPGRVHDWRISAQEPGIYWGECVEFCGLSHANMQIRAVALDDADYEEWLRVQQTQAALPTTGSAADGAAVFVQHCVSCHVIENGDAAYAAALETRPAELLSGVAPRLTHLMSRVSFAGALFDLYEDDGSVNIADLREWVRDAPSRKPMDPDNFQGMPSFVDSLSDDDLDDVVAFLMTLGPAPILP